MGVGGTQKRTGGGGTHRGTDVGIGEGLRNASGATKGGGIKIIDEGVSDKKNDDMKLQVQILIEAEEDPERKALFREYLAKAKNMMHSVLKKFWMILSIINFLSCSFSRQINI